MNREQLAHVLRAASRITYDPDILVIGSQAILGTYEVDSLPREATMSVESDIAFWNDPDEEKSDLGDGALGEYSQFHQTFDYYAQGVSVTTAVLPAGWEARPVRFDESDQELRRVLCLEPHDLVVSKLVRADEKDVTFARALIADGLVDPNVLQDRAGLLDRPEAVRQRVRDLVRRCVHSATRGE